MSKLLTRLAAILAAGFASILLTACGGGAETPQQPQQPPTVKDARVTIQSVTTPTSGDSPIVATVMVADAATAQASASGQCDGKPVALTATVLPPTGGTVTVTPVTPYAGACEVVVAATATNGAGTAVTDSETVKFTAGSVKFDRFRVIATSDIVDQKVGYLHWVKDDGSVVPLVNNTGYHVGLCGVYDKQLADKRPLGSCTTPLAGNTRRTFVIDPTTGTLGPEYTGALPDGAVLWTGPGGTFGDTPYAAHDVTRKGMYADEPGVVYYYTSHDSLNLRKTTDGFRTNTVVHTTTNGVVLVWSWSGQ